MKIRMIALAALVGVGTALGAAGCGSPRYEDCEVSDQEAREPDCGYWERDGEYFTVTAVPPFPPNATWHWWSWVTVGQTSFPPEGWKPPHGLTPPEEDAEAEKRRKNHEKKTVKDRPKTGPSNRQGVPKTGGNKPAQPKPATKR